MHYHHHLPPWIRSSNLFRHRHIAIVSWGVHDPRLCFFTYEYFLFLGRVTNPSAKPPFLEDQFVSLSQTSLLRPVRFVRPYQEHKFLAGIARKVIKASKPPPPYPPQQGGDSALISQNLFCWHLATRIKILLASCQQISMTYTVAVCTVINSWWCTEEL